MTRKRERVCVCVFVCGVSWDSPSVELLVFVVCSQNVWIGVLLGKGVEVLSAQLEDEELFGRQVRVASRRSLCWVREYWGKYDYAPGPGLVEAGLRPGEPIVKLNRTQPDEIMETPPRDGYDWGIYPI